MICSKIRHDLLPSLVFAHRYRPSFFTKGPSASPKRARGPGSIFYAAAVADSRVRSHGAEPSIDWTRVLMLAAAFATVAHSSPPHLTADLMVTRIFLTQAIPWLQPLLLQAIHLYIRQLGFVDPANHQP